MARNSNFRKNDVENGYIGGTGRPCSDTFLLGVVRVIRKGRRMKYIVVTGGVISGLGKGITISSIG